MGKKEVENHNVKELRKSLKVPKPHLALSLRYKPRKSYSDP